MRKLLIIKPILIGLFIFLPLMFLGLFIVPIAILFKQPRNETNSNGLFIPYKFPKIFWLWDNDRDGICGDNGFKHEHCPDYHLNYGSFLCNYIWCAIRNPIANASWYFGVDAVITKIEYDGNWSFAYDENGKCYAFYKYVGEKFSFYVGYKNDNVEDTPKHYIYNIGFALRTK